MSLSMPQRRRLTLEAMTPSGECITHDDGMVVFVAGGLPGETVEVEIVHRRRHFVRAHVARVLTPSPDRVTPRCPYFGTCGGCTWQHIDYAKQLIFKRDIVHEQLQRIGRFAEPAVRDCIPSPTPYGYRNRIQLVPDSQGQLGFRARGSHAVVAIDACAIAHDRLNAAIASASALVSSWAILGGTTFMTTKTSVDLRVAGDEVHILPPESDTPAAENQAEVAAMYIQVGPIRYRVTGQAFFQVNSGVAELLVREVLHAARVQPGEHVLDLYSGVGLFTVPLALTGADVIGIEASRSSVMDGRYNTHAAGCDHNTRLIVADVRTGLKRPDVMSMSWDTVIADPPRAGIEREALMAIIDLHPRAVVYVSCDPATLARDAGLLAAYGWVLHYAQPLDMFPQTQHVETVALFVRSPARPARPEQRSQAKA